MEAYEAQKAVDDMGVAINDHKILAYIASHRLVRPTRLEEEEPRIKKIRIRVMEPTSSIDSEARAPLRMAFSSEQQGMYSITDTPLVTNDSEERAPLRMTLSSEQQGEFSITDTPLVINEYIEEDNVKSEKSEL